MGVFSRTDKPEMARCSVCGKEHPLATMVTRHRNPEDVASDVPERFPAPVDWWLEDADALHAEHPRSFFIPPADRRRSLRDGELVRLGFIYGPHADREGEGHVERMWVEVLGRQEDGSFVGRLRNHPGRLSELAIGDRVAFEAAHVLGIDYTDAELGYAQDQWPIVDRVVTEEDRPPDVVVRGPSPFAEGEREWWMFCRNGSLGPTREGVGMLTDRFPGLETPLRAGDGVWELDGGDGVSARWRRVSDEELAGEGWQRLLAWLDETSEHLRSS